MPQPQDGHYRPLSASEARRAWRNLFLAGTRRSGAHCATAGCDRRPARGSSYCGCCQEDRMAGRVTVFRGGDEGLCGIGERKKAEAMEREALPYGDS